MAKFELRIVDAMVTEFNEDTQDWSGREYSKRVDIATTFETKDLMESDIILALSNHFYDSQLTTSDLFFANGTYASFNRVENGDGNNDENGKFLVDYYFTVTPICASIDLENKFGE